MKKSKTKQKNKIKKMEYKMSIYKKNGFFLKKHIPDKLYGI